MTQHYLEVAGEGPGDKNPWNHLPELAINCLLVLPQPCQPNVLDPFLRDSMTGEDGRPYRTKMLVVDLRSAACQKGWVSCYGIIDTEADTAVSHTYLNSVHYGALSGQPLKATLRNRGMHPSVTPCIPLCTIGRSGALRQDFFPILV